MKAKAFIAVVAAAALAIPAFAIAKGGPRDRVTGGGQTDFGAQGPGDTIAFTVQGAGEDVKGQIQYIDREADSAQAIFHGEPLCMTVDGNQAMITGEWTKRDGSDNDSATFSLYVRDNGEGSAAPDDVVAVSDIEDPDCALPDEDNEPTTALGRGNVQVYDATP